MTTALPVLVEIVRSGVVEGHHRGAAVALRPDGQVDWAVGDPFRVILPRSCNKPLQAAGMVDLGLELPDELLALAAASHSGEGFHVDGVRRILAGAGLDEAALRCPSDWPLEDVVRDALLRAGGERARVLMNCSGKHAAMLATCVLREWDTATYLDPGHPLQVALHAAFVAATGEPAEVAVDGCGAPLLSASLAGLAQAFARLAGAGEGPYARVAAAMRTHPEYVSGTRRDEVVLHRAVPGLVCKMGAEGVYVAAVPDSRAWALKIDDGAQRARPVVMARMLERSGVLAEPGVDAEAVRAIGRHVLRGGPMVVGELRAVF